MFSRRFPRLILFSVCLGQWPFARQFFFSFLYLTFPLFIYFVFLFVFVWVRVVLYFLFLRFPSLPPLDSICSVCKRIIAMLDFIFLHFHCFSFSKLFLFVFFFSFVVVFYLLFVPFSSPFLFHLFFSAFCLSSRKWLYVSFLFLPCPLFITFHVSSFTYLVLFYFSPLLSQLTKRLLL